MQIVQFSPFLLFLGHSVRVVQYKLVEQTEKVDLMFVRTDRMLCKRFNGI